MKNFFFLAIILLLVSCSKEDEEPAVSIPLLTVVAEKFSIYSPEESESWIIINDMDGKVVEYAAIKDDETITIETTKSKITEISVTVLTIMFHDGHSGTFAKTYPARPAGGIFTIQYQSSSAPNRFGQKVGSATVKTTAPWTIFQATLSSEVGKLQDDMTLLGGNVTATINLDNSNKYLFQISDFQGSSKYKILEGLHDGDVVTVPYEEFSDYDKVTTFEYPEQVSPSLAFIMAKEAGKLVSDPGYWTSFYLGAGTINTTSLKLGYLSSLPINSTYVSAGAGKNDYIYLQNTGTPPATVSWPSASQFTVNNSSIKNFSCTTNVPIVGRVSDYGYTDVNDPNNSIRWTVYSSSNTSSIGEVPAELLTKYPMLDQSKLVYWFTDFILEGPGVDNPIDYGEVDLMKSIMIAQ